MICCKYCGRPTRRFFDKFCSDCCNRLKENPLEVEYKQREPIKLTSHEVLIRIAAAFLAVIGAFWGFLLFAIFRSEGDPLRVMIFALIAGPGYLVTAGYLWRAAGRPSYQWRIAIWIASILVQGFWLLNSIYDRPNIPMLWWFIGCTLSIAALLMESKDQ